LEFHILFCLFSRTANFFNVVQKLPPAPWPPPPSAQRSFLGCKTSIRESWLKKKFFFQIPTSYFKLAQWFEVDNRFSCLFLKCSIEGGKMRDPENEVAALHEPAFNYLYFTFRKNMCSSKVKYFSVDFILRSLTTQWRHNLPWNKHGDAQLFYCYMLDTDLK